MGYNTMVLVLNDNLDQLRKHPDELVEFIKTGHCQPDFNGQKGWNRIRGVSGKPGQTTVLPPQHSSQLGVLVYGENCVTQITDMFLDTDMKDPLLFVLEKRAKFAKKQAEACLEEISRIRRKRGR